jgi:hypothetical protein
MAHSVNAGGSWQFVNTNVAVPSSIGIGFLDVNGDVCFIDSLHGWACGGLGTVIHTSDGGATWQNQALPGSYQSRHAVCIAFVDSLRGWLGGEGDTTIFTIPPTTGNGVNKIKTALYTTDGGAHWIPRTLGIYPYGDITDMQFIDSLHGWMCDDAGTIIHTIDGGLNWKTETSPTDCSNLRSIFMLSDTIGWACGNGGKILRITQTSQVSIFKSDKSISTKLNRNKAYLQIASAKHSLLNLAINNSENVSIAIYDLSGKMIKQIANTFLSTGTHRIAVVSNQYPKGIFILRVNGLTFAASFKFINGI